MNRPIALRALVVALGPAADQADTGRPSIRLMPALAALWLIAGLLWSVCLGEPGAAFTGSALLYGLVMPAAALFALWQPPGRLAPRSPVMAVRRRAPRRPGPALPPAPAVSGPSGRARRPRPHRQRRRPRSAPG